MHQNVSQLERKCCVLLNSMNFFFVLYLVDGFLCLYLQKKSKDHFGIEGDEGSTMVEDSVSPLK
jgi:hypothetical protein